MGPTWSAARVYLVVAGVYLVGVGVIGFFYDASFPIGAEAARRAGSAEIFGIFETNGWHNVAGLLFGAVAVYFATRPRDDVFGALVLAVPNALVTVAFAVEDPRTFWFASNGADNVVHATLGFGGIVVALLTWALRSRRQVSAA